MEGAHSAQGAQRAPAQNRKEKSGFSGDLTQHWKMETLSETQAPELPYYSSSGKTETTQSSQE